MTVARSLGIRVFHPTAQGHNDPVVRWDPTHKHSSHHRDCSRLRAVQSMQARGRLVLQGAAGQPDRFRLESFVGQRI